jgi:hypothetical protein
LSFEDELLFADFEELLDKFLPFFLFFELLDYVSLDLEPDLLLFTFPELEDLLLFTPEPF